MPIRALRPVALGLGLTILTGIGAVQAGEPRLDAAASGHRPHGAMGHPVRRPLPPELAYRDPRYRPLPPRVLPLVPPPGGPRYHAYVPRATYLPIYNEPPRRFPGE
ncbi:hypothetical protein [Methylobacterium sp. A54F]